jgi:hypothetical protein
MQMRAVHSVVSPPPNGLAVVVYRLNATVTDLTHRAAQQYDIMLRTLQSVDKQGAALYKNVAATKQSLRDDIETAQCELERQNRRADDVNMTLASLASRCDSLAARCDNLAAHNELVARALVAAAVYPTGLVIALFIYFRANFG